MPRGGCPPPRGPPCTGGRDHARMPPIRAARARVVQGGARIRIPLSNLDRCMRRNFAPSLDRRQGDDVLSESYWNSGVMTQEKKRGPPPQRGLIRIRSQGIGEITGEYAAVWGTLRSSTAEIQDDFPQTRNREQVEMVGNSRVVSKRRYIQRNTGGGAGACEWPGACAPQC